TAPLEMSLSATIWNPPLALAFVKMTMALVLLGDREKSLWWSVGSTATAVLAVQCHSSAVFVAAPVIISWPVRDLLAHRRHHALISACASAAVVLALEAPFLADVALHGVKRTSPPVVVASVSSTLEHPELLRPAAAFHALE